jgi:hypothetical protein
MYATVFVASKCEHANDVIPVDKVLESCFQLLSLFYLTIGRNNEAPATYAMTSTVKRLLDHLTEAELYSAKDLGSIKSTLEDLSKSIHDAATDPSPDKRHPPYMLALLENRVALCNSTLSRLQKRLERLPDYLLEAHEKLISILRSISLANTKSKVRETGMEWNVPRCANVTSSPHPRSRSYGTKSWKLAKSTMGARLPQRMEL